MSITNKLAVVFAALALSLGLTSVAKAETALTDDTGVISAMLRLSPAQPTAGKQTAITFDVTLQHALPVITEAAITVTDKASGSSEGLKTTMNGSTVSGDYTFKKAGTYALKLIVADGQSSYTFRYDQTVGAAAVADQPSQQSSTAVAIGTLLVMIAVVASVAMVALRRKPKVKV